jgi:hypothetical protein
MIDILYEYCYSAPRIIGRKHVVARAVCPDIDQQFAHQTSDFSVFNFMAAILAQCGCGWFAELSRNRVCALAHFGFFRLCPMRWQRPA